MWRWPRINWPDHLTAAPAGYAYGTVHDCETGEFKFGVLARVNETLAELRRSA